MGRMENISSVTPDLVQANIEAIAELFPNVVTEALDAEGNLTRSIDFDQLRQELSDHVVDGPQERYQLNWPGKRAAILAANAPTRATLRPMLEESESFDVTKNLFIAGDNLDALKLLQESYLGKVKLIYIDPPYNTGNDFIYNDEFAETASAYLERSGQVDGSGKKLIANSESNGRFHSDWLSMMYPRLKLAKTLLSDDGILAISIDDNEQARIVQLLVELFGDSGRVAQVVIQANKGGRDYLPLAQTHEYLILFARTPGTGIFDLPRDTSQLPLLDEIGPYEARELRNRNPRFTRENRPNLFYAVHVNPDIVDSNGYSAVSLVPRDGYSITTFPRNSQGSDSCWRWGQSKFLEAIKTDSAEESQVVAKQVRTGTWNVYEKNRPTTQKAKTIWDETEVRTEAGTREVRELFGASVFDHPKPLALVQKLISIATSRDSLILDFFAGSATTAHAVMAQNSLDGGCRNFIAIQLPEACDLESEAGKLDFKTLADVAMERIRLAGASLNDLNIDTGFRSLKVDSGTYVDVLRSPEETQQLGLEDFSNNIEINRTDEDLLFQVMLDWGLELSLPIISEMICGTKIFDVDGGSLLACFSAVFESELLTTIALRKPLRVVFRDSGFTNDSERINVEQIFRELSPDTQVKVI